MLEIHANGRDWNAPIEPLTVLFKTLDQRPLDPVFETMGNFIIKHKNPDEPRYHGCTQFLGHFATVNFVFNVITDEKVLIEEMTKAIRINQQRLDYEALRKNTLSF